MKASSESLRRQNRALVLSTLRRLGRASHTEIADWSGLSSATVSAITAELEDDGILIRREQQQVGGRGRPRIMFGQNPVCAFVAAVRIYAENLEYSLADYSGTLKDRFTLKRDLDNQETNFFVEQFKGGLDRLVERAGISRSSIRTISITTKGLVARGRPVLLWSPVLDDTRIDFANMLKPDWDAHVTLTNETRFAAQALASRHRSNEVQMETRRFACLSLDHAVGLGVATLDLAGTVTSFAPPFGHMVHVAEGPLCRCGLKGCIEAYAGFYGILRTAFEAPPDVIPAKFIPLREMEKIADNARNGDRMAQYAFRLAGDAIGMGISRLHSFLGLMPVTITGPGVSFFDLMQSGFEKHVSANLQVRFESVPEVNFELDEPNLIYEGNVEASLVDLDQNVIAARRAEGLGL
ncbi:MAG: ROK family transcriptional regulator [Rhizobiaceae bacterium]